LGFPLKYFNLKEMRRMKLKAITGIALTMLLLAVGSPIDVSVGVVDFNGGSGDFVAQSGVDWWPMFRHDLNHTGYSTSTAPNTNNTIWSYRTGFTVRSSPAVADGKVYVGSSDYSGSYSKVCCLNATTGAHIWNYTTGFIVYSSPAVSDGKVYVGSCDTVYFDSKVYCLNATTGAHIWNYTTGYPVLSSPAVSDGKVYVGSEDFMVYCLNATTGAHIWNYPTGGCVSYSPAVAYGKVYVGSEDDRVYCLNASAASMTPNQREIWTYTTGGDVYSSPAVAYGKVYVGSEDHRVYCLDATTGAHIWNYTTGGLFGVRSSPAVADGKVYVGSSDFKVYCLDATTGAHIWSYTTGSYVWSSPAVADGKVYIGSYDGNVYAFGPPPSYTLTVHSSPTEVTFTVDGVSRTTPWSGTYSEGASASLVMPEIHTVGEVRYHWSQWSDGNTSRSRTVTMTTNITLTAYYTGPYYELTATSSLITGITFTIDGVPWTTPYTEWLLEGSYTLEMPETYDGYVWANWLEDGDPNRIKTVTMDTNVLLTAVFIPPDTTPPTISIVSPENKTYPVADVPLTFTASESTSWVGYSLDGQANVTITGNTPLSGLSDGSHSLIVYAKDTAGNTGASQLTNFTIETKKEELFPTWIVAAIVIIAIVGAALLVYFTKIKKTT
jgi:outer membrane protein assembly factor BamB